MVRELWDLVQQDCETREALVLTGSESQRPRRGQNRIKINHEGQACPGRVGVLAELSNRAG
jgi:hypothetical protein